MGRNTNLLISTALAVVAIGCESGMPALDVTAVRPNLVASDRESIVLVEGSFYAPISADLVSGQQHVGDEFEVELGGMLLDGIELISETQITAVISTGFPQGEHDLVVRDPLDREALLERAIRVLPGDGSCPLVTIESPADGQRFPPGSHLSVQYHIIDNPPGRITAVEWSVSGALEQSDEQSLATPIYEYTGSIELNLPLEPTRREVYVLIFARDDAPRPNEGSARLMVIVDNCQLAADCDDGLFCNGVERCVGGVCVAGDPPDCADSVACTADICDEESRTCTHQPNDGACDDRLFCNGEERCYPVFGCVPGHSPCDDEIDCTADTCEEATDECFHSPDNELCRDDIFCNGEEECLEGVGCVPGRDPCEDGQECSMSICREDLQQCDVELHDELCEDGNECTINTCVKDVGCVSEPATEGPRGDVSCDDSLDNDCDGLIDSEDDDCDD